MEFINSAISYLTSKSNKFISKLFFLISFIFVLLLIDNIFGYTFYKNTENQIVQLDKITTLLKEPTVDFETKSKILEIKHEILQRKNFQDYLNQSLQNISFDNLSQSVNEIFKKVQTSKRNIILQYLSSAWIELLFMFVLTTAVSQSITRAEKNNEDSNKIFLRYLLAMLGLFLIGLIHSVLLSFIPIPFGIPFLSYVLNFVITLIIIFFVNFIGEKTKKTNG